MPVKIRQRKGKWQYDIRILWPEGGEYRERKNAPVTSKSGAQRWAEAREAALLKQGRPEHTPASDVPTLDAFWPRVLNEFYRANKKKASTIDEVDAIVRRYFRSLSLKTIDQITTSDVANLKVQLQELSPKTVNNVLSVLSRTLRCAVEWEVLTKMPCRIQLLNASQKTRDWYELDEYRRLIEAASSDARTLVIVLLAGSAGLRRGEIRALRWVDLDFDRRLIHVDNAIWRRVEDTPKGGRGRIVPMTPELVEALGRLHRTGERVLYSRLGREVSNRMIRTWVARAERKAGLVKSTGPLRNDRGGGVHKLRHTFCSHLALAGAPVTAIQQLAGHADLRTTQRYMHLSPNSRATAIDGLVKFYEQDVRKRTRPKDSGGTVK